jgi:hypothetical protein
MKREKVLQIGRTASGEVRLLDPEMVEKVGEACCDRNLVRGFGVGVYCGSPLFAALSCQSKPGLPTAELYRVARQSP